MTRGHKTAVKGNALRLTVGERLMTVMAVAAMALTCAYALVVPGTQSAQASGTVISYTVRPGDTLWSFAAGATPEGGDVNDTVDELMRLNHLDSAQLSVGQRIVVPVEQSA